MKKMVVAIMMILLVFISTPKMALTASDMSVVPAPVAIENLQQQITNLHLQIISLHEIIMLMQWQKAGINIDFRIPLGVYLVVDQLNRVWLQCPKCTELHRFSEFDIPKELRGQELIPLRPLFESFGHQVSWINNKVYIIDPFSGTKTLPKIVIGSNGRAYISFDSAQKSLSLLGHGRIVRISDILINIIKIEALG